MKNRQQKSLPSGIILIPVLILFWINSVGQSHVTKAFKEGIGLPSNRVFSISQGDDGNLLVVTDKGMACYNGIHWMPFPAKLNLPTSQNSTFRKVKNHGAWVAGYNKNELVIANYLNGKWQFLPDLEILDSTLINSNLSFDIRFIGKGNYELYLGVLNQLFKFQSENNSWERIELTGNNRDEISDVRFFKNEIHILTKNGIWSCDDNNHFNKYPAEFPQGVPVKIEPDTVNNQCYLLGAAWLGKIKDGKFSIIIPKFKSAYTDIISSAQLTLAENGRLFFGLNSNIYFLRRDGVNYEQINVIGQVEAFWHNDVFIDRENNIWISTDRGLGVISDLNLKFFNNSHGLPEAEVSGLIEVREKTFLVGSNYSLSQIENGQCSVIFSSKKRDLIYRFSNFQLHDNKVYFNTYQKGVGYYTDQTGIFWLAPVPPGRARVNSFFFIEDSLFVLCDQSIYHWNNGIFIHQNDLKGYARRAVSPGNGNVYILNSEGVFVFRGKGAGKYIKGRSTSINNVFDMLLLDNQLLLGTQSGPAELIGDSITPFELNSGNFNRPVFELFQSKEGNVWLGTDDGLLALQNKNIILHLNKSNGLIGNEINRGTVIQSADGNILTGTDEGLAIYLPDEDQSLQLKPIPAIFSITAPIVGRLNIDSTNSLSHNQNGLEIKFGAISLTDYHHFSFRYMLEGYDNEWLNKTGNRLNSLNYVNLPGGNYRFRLQVMENDQSWSEVRDSGWIRIKNPFYKTWYFVLLIVIILVGLSLHFYQFVIQKKILKQKLLIETQHQTISKSIRYAKRIQEAILPAPSQIKTVVNNSFIYYKPKDLVSGDFYWFQKKNNSAFFAAADGTGHGIPGAMVSVVCSNAINRVFNETSETEPSEILNKVKILVVDAFQNDIHDVSEGMDIALCRLDLDTNTLSFSGANLSLFRLTTKKETVIERHVGNQSHILIEYKGDSQHIGKSNQHYPFKQMKIKLIKGDIIYLATDGFSDQFGGEKKKKLMKIHFMELLLSLCNTPFEKQNEELERFFEEWSKGEIQVDDVCVIGVKA